MFRTWGVCWAVLLLQAVLYSTSSEAPPNRAVPYKPGKPDINLTRQQQAELDAGSLVESSLKVAGGGRAIAVQDIEAPPEYVFDRVLDFPKYPQMVPKVKSCHNYHEETHKNGTKVYKTQMSLNLFGVKFENHFFHTYEPSLNAMTWTLDYDKKSTVDDSVGLWYVVPHPAPEKPHWSRVYYSCQLNVPSWIPGLVKGYLSKKALREATTWVKRESESKFAAEKASGKLTLSTKGGGLFGGGAPQAPSWFGGKQPQQSQQQVVDAEPEPLAAPQQRSLGKKIKQAAVGAGYGFAAYRLYRAHYPSEGSL